MTTLDVSAPTPDYVHDLLDTLIGHVPLNFHGHEVPHDVHTRLRHRAPRRHPIPAQAHTPPAVPAQAPAQPPAAAPSPPAAPPRRALTDREHAVLTGMAAGKSNLNIGKDLYVAEDTVKTHARRLFRKLGARDRAHAVAIGFRTGLLQVDGER